AGRADLSDISRTAIAGRIEPIEQIVLLSDYAEVIPANAQVECQAWRHTVAVLQVETVAVLKGMAASVAGDLGATVHDTRQEVGQTVERHRAAKIVIDHLHDGRPAVFVTEFHIVLTLLP